MTNQRKWEGQPVWHGIWTGWPKTGTALGLGVWRHDRACTHSNPAESAVLPLVEDEQQERGNHLGWPCVVDRREAARW